jgi:tetratricopeptide (TPR) repeat protein
MKRKNSCWQGYLVVLSVFLVLCAQSGAAEKNAIAYWKQGTRDAASKLYTDAINNFTRAIKVNKGEVGLEDAAKIFNERGLVYLHLKQYETAASDFENAVRLDSRNGEFHYNLGQVAVVEKRYRDAIEHYSAAIEVDPRNARYYSNRGMIAMETRNYDRAIDDYTRVLVHDQTQGMAYYYRGLAYKNKDRTDEALRDFDRVLERYPKNADAFYQKASIFSRMKKIDVACILLEEAVANGFSAWTAIRDNRDFDAIRETTCYRQVMKGK